jgi:tetratricopeptide (TPR) repeat protein
MFGSRRSRIVLVVGLLLLVLGGVLAWRLYTTRTAYLLERGQAALERGDWGEAARLMRALDKKDSPSASRLFRGKTWTYLGRAAWQEETNASAPGGGENARAQDAFRHALAEFTRLRDAGPLGLEGTVLGAECLVRLGERRLAAETLTTVVSRHEQGDGPFEERGTVPFYKDAHRLLAAIYMDLNSPFDAIEHLREWARLDPDTGRPCRWIGFFYKDYQRPADAALAYQEALRRSLEPSETIAVLKELAETQLEGLANHKAALDTLDEAGRKADSLSADLRVLRARCLLGLGRAPEAVAELDTALRQEPNLVAALLARAKVFLAEGQPRAALPLLDTAVRVDPNDLESRQFLMQAYGQAGDRERAERERQRVEELKAYKDRLTKLHEQAQRKPWDDQVRYQIAELCQGINRPAEARMWLEAALACNPNNTKARQLLEQVPAHSSGQRSPASP